MFFIAEKTLLILYQGSKGGPLFSRGGGCQTFSLPYTYLLFSRGGGCLNPISPSGSANGQCHHNGTIFITVPLLTTIVRH